MNVNEKGELLCSTCGKKIYHEMAITIFYRKQENDETIYFCSSFCKLVDEARIVARNMELHGGSFVKHLGRAIACADDDNLRKINLYWEDYWEKYLNWGNEKIITQRKGVVPADAPNLRRLA